jgi:hypothetical protein
MEATAAAAAAAVAVTTLKRKMEASATAAAAAAAAAATTTTTVTRGGGGEEGVVALPHHIRADAPRVVHNDRAAEFSLPSAADWLESAELTSTINSDAADWLESAALAATIQSNTLEHASTTHAAIRLCAVRALLADLDTGREYVPGSDVRGTWQGLL